VSAPRTWPVPTDAPGWRFPAVERFALGSGLKVVACHLPGRPVLDLRLVVDGGVGRESRAEAGVARLTAKTLVHGSELRRGLAFQEAVELLGGHFQGSAHWSGTVVGISAPYRNAAPALGLLSELVASPGFHPDDVADEVHKRVDRATVEKLLPQAALGLAYLEALMSESARWGLVHDGPAETVASITSERVRDWWSTYAYPAGATLIVAGDLTGLDLAAAADHAFGPWAGPDRNLAPLAAEETAPGGRTIVIDQPGAVQTTLMVGHASAPVPYEQRTAVGVGARVLGGMFSSRLVRILREEMAVAYSVGASITHGLAADVLGIAAPVEGAATAKAVSVIIDQVATLADTLTEAEVRAAADYAVRRAPISYTSSAAVAEALERSVLQDLPDDHVDRGLEALRSISVDEVAEAVRQHFSAERLTVAAAGAAGQIADELEALRPGVEVLAPALPAGLGTVVLGA
jgi:predicted Zn-dependent peptidase